MKPLKPFKAWISDVQRFSVHDGPGIRTTVFFKGCPLRCAWCQNPESLDRKPQLMVFSETCLQCKSCRNVCPLGKESQQGMEIFKEDTPWHPSGCKTCGRCVEICPTASRQIVGREITLETLIEWVLRDQVFYGEKGGVTCSGGEPLLQWDFVRIFTTHLRQIGIHVALDTACVAPWPIIEEVPRYVDLIVADLKMISPEEHRRWTGMSNETILKAIRFWNTKMPEGALWISLPLVPGVHDKKEITRIVRFITSLDPTPTIRLLPYHPLGNIKYRALGKPPPPFSKDAKPLVTFAREMLSRNHVRVIPE